MQWLLPATIAYATGVFILVVINTYLYVQHRQRSIKFWAISWGIYFLRFACLIISLLWHDSLLLSTGYYLFIVISAIFLLNGTVILIGQTPAKWPIITGTIMGPFVVFSLFHSFPVLFINIVVFGFQGLIYILTGYLIIKNINKGEFTARIVGWLFIAWGIHQLDYPLLRPVQWFAPFGFIIGGFFAISVAIGIIIIFFERTQYELSKNEDNFRRLIERNPVAMAVADKTGKFIHFNNKFVETFGYTIADIPTVDDWWPLAYPEPEYRQKVINSWRSAARKAIKDGKETENHEWRVRCKDGSLRDIEFRMASLQDVNIVIFNDITERKKMEEDLLKSRKLESVSILSKGIAHDFNNLLTSVLGFVSLSRALVPPSDEVYKYLTIAENACVKAKELTHQLDNFASGVKLERKTLSLAHLLQDSSGLLSTNANFRVNISIPDNLWSAEIDERQIFQVMHELLENAGEAMPNGGVIDIVAKNTVISSRDLLPLQEGHYIKISVKDHGVGIPKENLSNIFEPYFTTKQMDYRSGVGLGLALCYAIVKGHKGYITVESEPVKGTVVHVYLPASPESTDQIDLPLDLLETELS